MKPYSAKATVDPRVAAAFRAGERMVIKRDLNGHAVEIQIAGLVCRPRREWSRLEREGLK